MKLYEHYNEIHKNSKMILLIDKEITTAENLSVLVKDLQKLVKINVEYLLKFSIDQNVTISNDDLIGNNPTKKIIYFNKLGLIGEDGKRINSLDITSVNYEEKINSILSIGENKIFKKFLENVYNLILEGKIDRAHILPFKKKALINELYSINGVGTIIGKKFGEPNIIQAGIKDISIIEAILNANIKKGFLKPRDKDYLSLNYTNFLIAYIDDIPVGCIEIIKINEDIIELGGLSVTENFLNYKIGLNLIKFVEEYAKNNNKTVISITNNPKLEVIYKNNGYILDIEGKYEFRSKKSPGKKLYYKLF